MVSYNRKRKARNNEYGICKDALGLTGKGSMKNLSAAQEAKFKRCKEKVRRQKRKSSGRRKSSTGKKK